MSPNHRRMCNELVHELCLEIPAKTADSILLTARNMYAYLEPRFGKKLIYRDSIVFLKATKANKQHVIIGIKQVVQNNESELVMINQEQWYDKFELKTNKFHVKIRSKRDSQSEIDIFHHDGRFMNAHLHYFLRLIAPLVQPIQLNCCFPSKPVERFVPILNTLSGCIDKIGLYPEQFNSTTLDEALRKYNNLEIFCPLSSLNVPKLVQWLNDSIGQPKKYLNIGGPGTPTDATLLLDEVKKDFACATSKCRFVVRMELLQPLDEFTLGNELTGERLQLRRIGFKDGQTIYALRRCPSNELDSNNEDNDMTFAQQMTDFFAVQQ